MAEQRYRSLSDLHESLLHLILARVDLYSLHSCAQVCKTWSLIITRSLSFARLHASLHTSHTWWPLFFSSSRDSMVIYDTLSERCFSTHCLDLIEESSIDTVGKTSEQREILKQLRYTLFDDELLATSEGLVLSRSEYSNNLFVTNIVTRERRLLPSPNPQLRCIAYVGMTYSWATMSYQVLLCGLSQTLTLQGRLFTCVYNSLTHCWTNANSTLGAELKFVKPKTCVWLGGHFYCVIGRALYLFNLETMEWDSLHSFPPPKDPDQPQKRVQVQLPSELVHLYCLWEHKGELRLAGCMRTEESKFVTQLWCYSPTECGVLQWQHFAHLPSISSDTDNGPGLFKGRRWYASGDTVCFRSYVRYGCRLETSKVQFCVQDLVKGDAKIVKSILSMDLYNNVSLVANLPIQPCPFTSP